MSSPRAPLARFFLTAAVVVLWSATTCPSPGAEPPNAARHSLENHRPSRPAKCAKAERHRDGAPTRKLARRMARGHACGRKRSGAAAQPVGAASVSTPTPNGVSAGPSSPSTTAPQSPPNTDSPSDPAATPGETPFRFFSPSSFWNTPLADDAAIDPESIAITGAFETTIAHEIQAGNGPWINTTDYSVPIYTVPADQPTVAVQLFSQFYSPSLQSAWHEVPLPPEARPSAGSDQHLMLWQPSSDRIWEFWKLTQVDGGWRAGWGGAMRNVSSNAGVYDADAWPGAESWWGSSASSLSIAGGLITLEDLRQGKIDHGLALAIPNVRSGFYTAPAQRTDGTSGSTLALPEGAHLRLDPDLDLATMQLPPLTLMVAEAAQRYGIVVRDRAKVVHFFAQDPSPTGANPYVGQGGYFEGKSPAQLLSQFPWRHLQLLAMELRHWG
jgi:hypothetical protein